MHVSILEIQRLLESCGWLEAAPLQHPPSPQSDRVRDLSGPTALIVHDACGGDILRCDIKLPSGTIEPHHFNQLGNERIDFLRQKFPEGTRFSKATTDAAPFPTLRSKLLSDRRVLDGYVELRKKLDAKHLEEAWQAARDTDLPASLWRVQTQSHLDRILSEGGEAPYCLEADRDGLWLSDIKRAGASPIAAALALAGHIRQGRLSRAAPFDAHEMRIVEYLLSLSPNLAPGSDPVGFLIASHAYFRARAAGGMASEA